jgi:membrane-associated phospholipid phosphatase
VEDRVERFERCGTRGRTRSFPSGHASGAFSSAGVICMSHAHLPLYGSVAGDATACGAAMLSASIISVLRIIADRHHATDVLVGMVSGLFTGLLLPYLLHFGWDPDGTPTMRTDPLAAPPATLSFSGSF